TQVLLPPESARQWMSRRTLLMCVSILTAVCSVLLYRHSLPAPPPLYSLAYVDTETGAQMALDACLSATAPYPLTHVAQGVLSIGMGGVSITGVEPVSDTESAEGQDPVSPTLWADSLSSKGCHPLMRLMLEEGVPDSALEALSEYAGYEGGYAPSTTPEAEADAPFPPMVTSILDAVYHTVSDRHLHGMVLDLPFGVSDIRNKACAALVGLVRGVLGYVAEERGVDAPLSLFVAVPPARHSGSVFTWEVVQWMWEGMDTPGVQTHLVSMALQHAPSLGSIAPLEWCANSVEGYGSRYRVGLGIALCGYQANEVKGCREVERGRLLEEVERARETTPDQAREGRETLQQERHSQSQTRLQMCRRKGGRGVCDTISYLTDTEVQQRVEYAARHGRGVFFGGWEGQ
ncbi:hypothetical protein KIPB_012252, partial [Kipferlia bialata]